MKCMIFGGSFYNKGAEAMSTCVIEELSKRGICDEFNFASFKGVYNIDKKALDSNFRDKKINKIEVPRVRELLQVLVLPEFLYSKSVKSLVKGIKDSDFIVDISGYTLCDKFGKSAALGYWLRTQLVKKLNRPYIIFPQAMGPFNNSEVAKLSKKAIENSQLVMLRDEKTMGYVEKLNVNNFDKIKMLPDIAFLFHERERVKNESKDKKVIIVPNVRAYEKSYNNDENYYIDSLIKTINEIPENYKICLLPHEYGNSGFDDVSLCKEILEKIGSKRQIELVEKQLSAIELKDIIATADLVITSRFHAAIAALSMGIPTITVGWADKYPQLLKLFECEEFAIDVSQLQTNILNDKVKYIIENDEEISNRIERNLVSIKQNSKKVFDSLEKFLGDNKC